MLGLTLEFWFYTLLLFGGGLVVLLVVMTVLASEAFWQLVATCVLLMLAGGVVWIAVQLGQLAVENIPWRTLIAIAGGLAIVLLTTVVVANAASKRRKRNSDRERLLNAVTRKRVFEALGIDDDGDALGNRTDHGFSEEEIARNAKTVWRTDISTSRTMSADRAALE